MNLSKLEESERTLLLEWEVPAEPKRGLPQGHLSFCIDCEEHPPEILSARIDVPEHAQGHVLETLEFDGCVFVNVDSDTGKPLSVEAVSGAPRPADLPETLKHIEDKGDRFLSAAVTTIMAEWHIVAAALKTDEVLKVSEEFRAVSRRGQWRYLEGGQSPSPDAVPSQIAVCW